MTIVHNNWLDASRLKLLRSSGLIRAGRVPEGARNFVGMLANF
jgi:hypothetical protein